MDDASMGCLGTLQMSGAPTGFWNTFHTALLPIDCQGALDMADELAGCESALSIACLSTGCHDAFHTTDVSIR